MWVNMSGYILCYDEYFNVKVYYFGHTAFKVGIRSSSEKSNNFFLIGGIYIWLFNVVVHSSPC